MGPSGREEVGIYIVIQRVSNQHTVWRTYIVYTVILTEIFALVVYEEKNLRRAYQNKLILINTDRQAVPRTFGILNDIPS